jgi:hypothetical protein
MTKPPLPHETQLYENQFMQLITIRWGKMTSILTIEDTQRFVDARPAMAAAGHADATGAQNTGSSMTHCALQYHLLRCIMSVCRRALSRS